LLAGAAPAFAQGEAKAGKKDPQAAFREAWQKAATPGENHALLKLLVGSWSTATKSWMDPSAPPQESTGTAEVKPIYVSAGHRISQESAARLALMVAKNRVLEPVRQADLRGREFIRKTWPNGITSGVAQATVANTGKVGTKDEDA
jgi:hypothetical protein